MVSKYQIWQLLYGSERAPGEGQLISRKYSLARDRLATHHIIPKCMGGSDDEDNLVFLTGREHFIVHLLLVRIYPDKPQLLYAAMMMSAFNKKQVGRSNNRQYEWLKMRYSKCVSVNQSGENNSQYGSMWICNIELKMNKKIKKDDPIPKGWIKGRNKWRKIKNCLTCDVEFFTIKGKYCSKECRPIKTSQMVGREGEFMTYYMETESINLALKKMGFIGAGGYYYWARDVIRNFNKLS